ncbi:MAG: hypothetical protein WBP96_08960, partial [Nitrososphaeraceae archaeon]
ILIHSLRDIILVYLTPRSKVLLGGIIELTLTNSDTAGCDCRTIQGIIKFQGVIIINNQTKK